MLTLGKTILEMDGYQVSGATSGALAFKILSKSKKPHLILLDMEMEDMSGPDFLKKLKNQDSPSLNSITTVFYSANENSTIGEAAGFIQKTGDIDQFLASVHLFLRPESDVA